MRKKIEQVMKTGSRSRILVYACLLGLVGLALMTWSLFDQGWIPVMMAMTVGQGIGTLSVALFIFVVVMDLRRATFRSSLPSPEPDKD
jgi:hypothetical protein